MDDCDYIIYFESGVLVLWFIAGIILSIYTCTRDARKSRPEDALRNETEEKLRLKTELKKAIHEKDEALKRLSAIMSSRLKDENPYVADLSDENRPTKLGEQFSELYDNQWTDAYSAIDISFKSTVGEYAIIQILLEIFKECFMECEAISKNQMERLYESVASILNEKSLLPLDLMHRVKEERKRLAVEHIPAVDMILPKLTQNFSPKYKDLQFLDVQPVKVYMQECLKLSWLMVIQDPPMKIVLEPKAVNHQLFKEYKTRGNYLNYVVWPALLLCENGALLFRGVAEFTSSSPSLQIVQF